MCGRLGRLVTIAADGVARLWTMQSLSSATSLELSPWTGEPSATTDVIERALGSGARAPARSSALRHNAARFTLDGRYVITSQARAYTRTEERDGRPSDSLTVSIKVWSALTGQLLVRMPDAHAEEVFSVAPHPWEPRLVATGGLDGVVAVWDAPSGTLGA